MRAIAGIAALFVCTAALAASSTPISSGDWEMTIVMTSVDMPGVPAAAMQAMVGQTHTVTHCITEEDAKKGPQELARQGSGDC